MSNPAPAPINPASTALPVQILQDNIQNIVVPKPNAIPDATKQIKKAEHLRYAVDHYQELASMGKKPTTCQKIRLKFKEFWYWLTRKKVLFPIKDSELRFMMHLYRNYDSAHIKPKTFAPKPPAMDS